MVRASRIRGNGARVAGVAGVAGQPGADLTPAIEAAAEAIARSGNRPGLKDPSWPRPFADKIRSDARLAVEAAAPILLAELERQRDEARCQHLRDERHHYDAMVPLIVQRVADRIAEDCVGVHAAWVHDDELIRWRGIREAIAREVGARPHDQEGTKP